MQHNDPQVFENYLKRKGIRFTGPLLWSKVVRTSRFIGRWTFRAVLAGAGIVGSQMLFDYAQENHPEKTALIIAITKEQYEKLSTSVKGIIEELSEDSALDELELPNR